MDDPSHIFHKLCSTVLLSDAGGQCRQAKHDIFDCFSNMYDMSICIHIYIYMYNVYTDMFVMVPISVF